MAVASSTAATISAIAGAASAAVGVVSAFVGGQQAQDQNEFQAQVTEQQAARERQLAAAQEKDFRRNQRRLIAQRRAAGGAAGVEAGTGSPLLVSEDIASEIELNALRIREGGDVRSTRLNQQAELFRRSGSSARTGSFVRAGSSLLTGIGSVAKVV